MNKIITFWRLASMAGTTFLNAKSNVIYEAISGGKMKKLALIFSVFILVFAPAPAGAEIVPITSVSTSSGAPGQIILDTFTVGSTLYTTATDLMPGTSVKTDTHLLNGRIIGDQDNFDLNLYFTRGANATDYSWNTISFGGINWSDSNGDDADFFIFEADGNDSFGVAPIFTDGSVGQYVVFSVKNGSSENWGDTGVLITEGDRAGQNIFGMAFAITDLKDAAGVALTNSTVIKGLAFDGPGTDIASISAALDFNSSDTDQDGLTYIEETTITFTDPTNADSDGDSIFDGAEVTKWGTDPNKFDSDDDGISDYDELIFFGSNPSNFDITGFTTLTTINGSDFTGSLGHWYDEGTAVYCADLRGYVEYDVEIPTDGIFKIEIEVAQHHKEPGYTPIPLIFYVDGEFISRQVSDINYGETATQTFITPFIKAGTRKIKIFWDNYHFKTYAQINSLKLISVDGPDADANGTKDWIDHHLGAQMTFEISQETRVSPMSIEGNTRFLNQLSLTAPAGITAKRANLNRWYAIVPLSATETTTVTADWCNGVKAVSRNLTWTQTNIFDDDEILIAQGSSLLLNAIPQGEIDGTVALTVDGTLNPGTFTPETPLEQLFDTAGEFIVSGVYTNTLGEQQTASITVKVIAPQSEEVLNIWINRDRDWIATSALSGEVVIDAPDVEIKISNNTYKITRHELYEDVNIVLRLGEGDPILSSIPTHCFALVKGVDGTLPIDTAFEDGTLLAYDTLVGLNLPAGIELRYYMTASGMSFEDGSTEQNMTNTSFSDLGVLRLGLLRLPERTGSFCTKFEIKQGSTVLGTN